MTNRKSITLFPMSLRWASYFAHKPHREGSKAQSGRFSHKTAFFSKEVCYKLSLYENFQRQSSITGLSNSAQMVGEDFPLNVNFVRKVNHRLARLLVALVLLEISWRIQQW